MPVVRKPEDAGRALQQMRRLTLFLLALSLLPVLLPTRSAVAGERADRSIVVRGRVVHGGTGRPVDGATVRLLSALPDGSGRRQEEVVTKSNGAFAFENLRRGRQRQYALEAVYDDGLFVDESFELGKDERVEDITVWDTTSDPSVITVVRDEIFIPDAGDENGAGVIEAVTVENSGDEAYIGRGQTLGGETGPGAPTLGFSVPTQAIGKRIDIVSSDLDRLYASDAGFGFVATVAIPPQREITTIFTYGIEQSTGTFDVSKRVLYPTEELSVYAGDPLEVSSNRLDAAGDETIEGQRYSKWTSTGGFDAGDLVSISVIAEGSSSPGFVWGLAGALGVIVLGTAVGLLMRRDRTNEMRTGQEKRAPAARSEAASRQEILVEIAELDLRHQSGDVSDEEYAIKRAELKKKVVGSRKPEGVR